VTLETKLVITFVATITITSEEVLEYENIQMPFRNSQATQMAVM